MPVELVLSSQLFHPSDHPCYPLSLLVLLESVCKGAIGITNSFSEGEPVSFLVIVVVSGLFVLFCWFRWLPDI